MTTISGETPANAAAWISAKGAPLDVRAAPYPKPAEHEIVVRNHAVAVNPLDWINQAAGDFIFSWIRYPFVLGSDLAGEVVAVGAGVTRFAVGDRVLAHAVGTDPKRNRAAEGAFQIYTVVLENLAAPIPDGLSYERASVLPLGLSTAACGLFEKDQLALRYPSAAPQPNGETVVVWGGSTSVGSNAIQLARAAGYDVVTTASRKNFDYVKALGAREAFDYHDERVVANVVAACRGRRLAGALAIGAGSAQSCVDVVAACEGNRFVAMATYPISFTGRTDGLRARVRMIGTFAWFGITMWLTCRRRGVRTKFIFGSSLIATDVSRIVYAEYLPAALAERRYIAAPDPHVVGHGLAAVQRGLDVQKRGVSAAKVVISLTAEG